MAARQDSFLLGSDLQDVYSGKFSQASTPGKSGSILQGMSEVDGNGRHLEAQASTSSHVLNVAIRHV